MSELKSIKDDLILRDLALEYIELLLDDGIEPKALLAGLRALRKTHARRELLSLATIEQMEKVADAFGGCNPELLQRLTAAAGIPSSEAFGAAGKVEDAGEPLRVLRPKTHVCWTPDQCPDFLDDCYPDDEQNKRCSIRPDRNLPYD